MNLFCKKILSFFIIAQMLLPGHIFAQDVIVHREFRPLVLTEVEPLEIVFDENVFADLVRIPLLTLETDDTENQQLVRFQGLCCQEGQCERDNVLQGHSCNLSQDRVTELGDDLIKLDEVVFRSNLSEGLLLEEDGDGRPIIYDKSFCESCVDRTTLDIKNSFEDEESLEEVQNRIANRINQRNLQEAISVGSRRLRGYANSKSIMYNYYHFLKNNHPELSSYADEYLESINIDLCGDQSDVHAFCETAGDSAPGAISNQCAPEVYIETMNGIHAEIRSGGAEPSTFYNEAEFRNVAAQRQSCQENPPMFDLNFALNHLGPLELMSVTTVNSAGLNEIVGEGHSNFTLNLARNLNLGVMSASAGSAAAAIGLPDYIARSTGSQQTPINFLASKASENFNHLKQVCQNDNFSQYDNELKREALIRIWSGASITSVSRDDQFLMEDFFREFSKVKTNFPQYGPSLESPDFLCDLVTRPGVTANSLASIDGFLDQVEATQTNNKEEFKLRFAEIYNNVCFQGNKDRYLGQFNNLMCNHKIPSLTQLDNYARDNELTAIEKLALSRLRCESLAEYPDQRAIEAEGLGEDPSSIDNPEDEADGRAASLAANGYMGDTSTTSAPVEDNVIVITGRRMDVDVFGESVGKAEASSSSSGQRSGYRDTAFIDTTAERRRDEARVASQRTELDNQVVRTPAGSIDSAGGLSANRSWERSNEREAIASGQPAGGSTSLYDPTRFYNGVTDISGERNAAIETQQRLAEDLVSQADPTELNPQERVQRDLASGEENLFGETENLTSEQEIYQRVIKDLREEIKRERMDEAIASESNEEIQRLMRENEALRRERFDMQRQIEEINGRIDTIARGRLNDENQVGAGAGSASASGSSVASGGGRNPAGSDRESSAASGRSDRPVDINGRAVITGASGAQSQVQFARTDGSSLYLRVRDDSGEEQEFNLTPENIFLDGGALRSIRVGDREILASDLSLDVQREALRIKLTENMQSQVSAGQQLAAVLPPNRSGRTDDPAQEFIYTYQDLVATTEEMQEASSEQ